MIESKALCARYLESKRKGLAPLPKPLRVRPVPTVCRQFVKMIGDDRGWLEPQFILTPEVKHDPFGVPE